MNDYCTDIFCSTAAELLQRGSSVRFSAPGHSMHPVIVQSDVLQVAPIRAEELSIGDIALYHAGVRIIAHRVVGINNGKLDTGCLLRKRITSFFPLRHEVPLFKGLRKQVCSSSLANNKTLQITLKGDACTTPDPPVTAEQILGKVIAVEHNGHHVDPYRLSCTLYSIAYQFLARLIRLFR
jgi:hypothetical protein